MATSTGLSAAGLGSGLDINGIVSQLMTLERKPVNALDSKEAAQQAKLSAYGSLKGTLSSLQSAMNALASPARFNTLKGSLGDATIGSVTVDPAVAQPSSYSLDVQSLARAQKLSSPAFDSTSSSVGHGTITIEFGTYSNGAFSPNPDKPARQIGITAGNDSLSGIRDAINTAGAGVTASIVNDGGNHRLLLGSQDTGLINSMKISIDDADGSNANSTGLSRLAYDATSGGTQNMSQSVPAQNAVLLVDGISISKPSDIIADAIDGVTLRLTKTSGGTPTTINVTRDTSTAMASASSFVSAYNTAMATIRSMGAYNADTRVAGVLQGDATLRSLQSQLRSLMNAPLSPAVGSLATLSDIGIAFQKDGTLTLDNARLQKVLSDPSSNVAAIFSNSGRPTDPQIAYVSAASNAMPGSREIDITRIATRGTAAGSIPATLDISTGINDQLVVSINGKVVNLSLPGGSYTADGLADNLQSRINGSSAMLQSKTSVKVTQTAGIISITSNLYGSSSSVTIDGGSAADSLFGVARSSVTGLDVQGSIGGLDATGSGQTLAGSGLTLQVTGGATGSRGTIEFTRGYAAQLEQMVSRVLADETGPIAGRVEGIGRTIKDIGRNRSVQLQRLEELEARYRRQFNALDSAISSMKSTSTYLQQQLANLPSSSVT